MKHFAFFGKGNKSEVMKKFLLSLEDKTYAFFHSEIVWLFVGLVAFLSWLKNSNDLSFYFFLSFGTLLVVFQSDMRLSLLSGFLIMMTFSVLPFFNTLTASQLGLIILAASLLIVMFIKRIVLHPLRFFSFGACGFSFLLMGLWAFIATAANQIKNPEGKYNQLGYLLSGMMVFFVILYFMVYLGSPKDGFAFLKTSFYVINAVLVAELIGAWHFDDLYNLGWATKNLVVMVLEFTLPFLALTFADDKRRFDCLILIGVDYYLSFVSDSRGGLITIFVLTLVLAFILTDRRVKPWWHSSLLFLGILFAFILSSFFLLPDFRQSIIRLVDMGGNLSNREEIWENAMAFFYKDKVFGGGMGAIFELWDVCAWHPGTVGVMYAHDTFITLLMTMGGVGLILYGVHIFEIFYSSVRIRHNEGFVLIYILLAGLIHGIIDNTFLTIIYMLPYIMVFSDAGLPSLAGRKMLHKETLEKRVYSA